MQSLLENLGPGDVICEPFPHVALVAPLRSYIDYTDLAEHFPKVPLPKQIQGNTAYRLSAAQWLKMSPMEHIEHGQWELVRKMNMGPMFIRDFVRVFGYWIEYYYGREFCKSLLTASVGTRGMQGSEKAAIHCDFQFVINTPATEEYTTVRDPHCDNPHELFAGLWYFGGMHDIGNGGDLQLHARADCAKDVTFHRSKWGKGSVSEDQLGGAKEVPYREDIFVMFLNTPHSIHSVTERVVCAPIRKYVNIIAEIEKPLFSLG